MFKEVQEQSFDAREREILKFWNDNKIFERSVDLRKGKKHFTFYDGPPFATGLPHYGHLLAGTIKDVVLRYKTMQKFYAPRRFGWDCHGLPVENEIEKAHELSGAASIEEFGIANFCEECRKIVLRYTEEWKSVVNRMGRWVDFSQTYRTMDLSFMESVWWVFKQLHALGLIYEGYKVTPFSAKLGTPLSNFEASENYKEVDDPSLTVSLPLEGEPNTYLLVWTTTPWTLISNLAVMAGPAMDYVKIKEHASGENYILAKSRLSAYYKEPSEYTLLAEFKGSELNKKCYQPLFSYFAKNQANGAFRVIMEDAVATDEGTGLVHSAPAFGEVDFYACLREGIELVCPVGNNGQFTKEIPEYEGLFVKDADKDIIKRLKQMGRVKQQATIRHRYPFCWRSDTPLIYKAVRSWFVSVEKIKETLIGVNNQIHWVPEHLKYGRFGKWLEGARDWSISRNRYWGTPIPIWRSEDGELIVIGSIAELEAATHSKVTDLHRHLIDHLTIEKNGKVYKRVPEVFDCWFESGSMPYAQNHYPFENRELFEENFPADFIAEGLDQTRGWFYTLTVLSAALFQKSAFKNVIVNGIVLASDGTKMSKRLKNYPDPMAVVQKYGADAIRLYMMNSPAVRAEDLCFKEEGVEIILRQVMLPAWNAFSFFVTYARIYRWEPPKDILSGQFKPHAVIDRWLLSLLNQLIQKVEAGMDAYDLNAAVNPFVDFIEQLTNWYIRRSRRRFWQDEATTDRDEAFKTLYITLITLTKIAAPFVPFISEAIYRQLRTDDMPESVHLCDFPDYQESRRDVALEESMQLVQTAVNLGHSLRKEYKLKVRQPLGKAMIATTDPRVLSFLQDQQHLIAEELNVKGIEFMEDEKELVCLKAKPNFRSLGKKVGKFMKAVQQQIEAFDQNKLAALLAGEIIFMEMEGQSFVLTHEDVAVERIVHEGTVAANAGKITVALDTKLTDDLLLEGLAREIVNKVNSMRRELDFAVTDRIKMKLETTERVRKCFEVHGEYIRHEVLCVGESFEPCKGTPWDLNGEATKIELTKF